MVSASMRVKDVRVVRLRHTCPTMHCQDRYAASLRKNDFAARKTTGMTMDEDSPTETARLQGTQNLDGDEGSMGHDWRPLHTG